MTAIPCIDIFEGKSVRLYQGDYSQMTVYPATPLAVAKNFENLGIKQMHLVDLEGAVANHVINFNTIKQIREETNAHIQFGGGVKSEKDLKKLFDIGINQVVLGSVALNDPAFFDFCLNKYGKGKIVLGLDFKKNKLYTNGWRNKHDLDISAYITERKNKIQYILSTNILSDGTLNGISTSFYSRLTNTFPNLSVIAAGGVSSLKDLRKLKSVGCYATIVGKAIYEGRLSIAAIVDFNN